jgi:ectoine hydroxylase-related dioxygenase (phytanoyl-CoA dioxygenase family)
MESLFEDLQRDGFAWCRRALSEAVTAEISKELQFAIENCSEDSVIKGSKQVVGVRNLMAAWPNCISVADGLLRSLPDAITDRLQLVRILFFDKPPGRSWALPLHRDETIAVAQHPPIDSMPAGYSRPTTKAGVFHVVAPQELLDQMLTLRLHLDPMDEQNGALYVVPGSHQCADGDKEPDQVSVLHASRGDLLLMRPRLLHGSKESSEGCIYSRRILHFEFAPIDALAEPLRWHWEIQRND